MTSSTVDHQFHFNLANQQAHQHPHQHLHLHQQRQHSHHPHATSASVPCKHAQNMQHLGQTESQMSSYPVVCQKPTASHTDDGKWSKDFMQSQQDKTPPLHQHQHQHQHEHHQQHQSSQHGFHSPMSADMMMPYQR